MDGFDFIGSELETVVKFITDKGYRVKLINNSINSIEGIKLVTNVKIEGNETTVIFSHFLF